MTLNYGTAVAWALAAGCLEPGRVLVGGGAPGLPGELAGSRV